MRSQPCTGHHRLPQGGRLARLGRLIALGVALVATSIWQAPATQAASPSSGTVDSTNPSTSWTGGPFFGFSWVAETNCVVKTTFCDTFMLTVGDLPATTPDVVVSVQGSESYDEFSIAIFDSSGQMVAQSTWDAPHTAIMRTAAPGTYEVRVELINGSLRLTTYEGRAFAADAGEPVDPNPKECPLNDQTALLEPDDGRWVDLDMLVLLDGLDPTYAASVFEGVSKAYEPLKIRVVPTFQVADPPFASNQMLQIMEDLRGRFPLGVPADYDVVEVLSGRDLWLGPSPGILGMADCVGGVAWDDRSFAVVEARFPAEGEPLGPLTVWTDYDAKLSAHEVGHLLGGEHHLGNCVEGIDGADDELTEDTSPCTLMENNADLMSLRFSTANGLIVRGYALRYASANDG